MTRTWTEFAAREPEMAAKGRALLTQYGIGLGFLATVRKDGGPRMHPFCPVFHGEGLFGLILPSSPKCGDLLRDGRYAIHAHQPEDRDDEFYITGTVRRADADTDAVRAAFLAQTEEATSSGDELCFEFLLDRALLAEYRPRGQGPTWPPVYTKWKVP